MVTGEAQIALLLVAAFFIVLAGANDGASIVALGLRGAAGRPVAALGTLTAAVVIAPLVLGTGVATVLERAAGGGPMLALVAVGTAGLVALGLASRGLPTSLTLALVGALTGTALGHGDDAPWLLLGRAVLFGLLAPAAGASLGWLMTRLMPRISPPASAASSIRWGHRLSYGATCVAYAANDGQKALAVAVLATAGLSPGRAAAPSLVLLAGVGALFALGTAIGASRNPTRHVAAIRPVHAMTAEACSAVAVLGGGLAGTPVSMTQSIAGAVIGSTAAEGAGRVRWGLASRLGLAWVTTLPAAFVVSAALGALVRAATA